MTVEVMDTLRKSCFLSPLSPEEFSKILGDRFSEQIADAKHFAVGLSGGPDSMALAYLLGRWAQGRKATIHALTVDHGLRPE